MTGTFFLIFTAVLTALSLVGVILNIKKVRACFYIWAVTNAAWCAIDIMHGIYMQALLFAIYFALAIWGIMAWRRPPSIRENEPHLAELEAFQKHMEHMEVYHKAYWEKHS